MFLRSFRTKLHTDHLPHVSTRSKAIVQNVAAISGPHVLERAIVMSPGKKNAGISEDGLRLTALTIDQTAKVLSAAAGRQVSERMIREALEAGAPSLPDGRINLIEFTAWLEKDLSNR